MRYGTWSDSDADSDVLLDDGLSSTSDSDAISFHEQSPGPRSTLGRNIRENITSSEESSAQNSEDEAADLLDFDDYSPKKAKTVKYPWRDTQASSSRDRLVAPAPRIPWQRRGGSFLKGKGPDISDLLSDKGDGWEVWMKEAEDDAMRKGQAAANRRRSEIRDIAGSVRAGLRREAELRQEREAEELRRMLEGVHIRQKREAEEEERMFAERERALWASIDAAIAENLRLENERRAEAERLARAKEEAEKRRVAEEERTRLEAERSAREQDERDKAERAKRAEEAKRQAEAQRAEEERKLREKAEKERGPGSDWRGWRERQAWMKREVIEVVKAEGVGRERKQGMRLMTRGLGQVVNTREGILRVTNDIHAILIAQLSSPPSPSSPTLLSATSSSSGPPPKTYLYLLSHLSKALIKQAESEVSAKAASSFPLARIVLSLLLRGHAALGEILFARLVKKCPWVVPHYPAKEPSMSREAYEKSTGRGSDEGLPDYIQRMAGITTLYFAILQTPLASLIPTLDVPPPTPEQMLVLVPEVFRLPRAWTWLAYALRDPLPGLAPTAHLLATWVEMCSEEVVRVYGRGQVGRVLEAIMREGLGAEGKIKGDSQAARARLELVLGRWDKGEVGYMTGRDWE